MNPAFHLALIYAWDGVALGIAAAAIVIFLCGLDDAFLDLTYLALLLTRRTRLPRPAMLARKPELRAAILVPAWQEAAVIAAMLQRLCATLDYANYRIFTGSYPNDPGTGAEVRRVAARFPQIQSVVVAAPGPTSKADCLNQLVAAAFAHERAHGEHFEFFVFQDAEDVIHPFSLKVMNWFIEFAAMVQLPVFSLDRRWSEFVACTYMDEFAEWHTKDLWVRSLLNRSVPSAGVATAFSRAALETLKGGGEIFNAASLTEDYEIAHRLNALGGTGRFIRYPLHRPEMPRGIVSTREFFPDGYTQSVRQKARWMLGIAFLGWRKIGWYGGWWNRYFLMRDRKALVSAPAAMFGYVLALLYLFGAGLVALLPWLGPLPALIRYDWEWWLIETNLIFLASRLIQRAIFVSAIHGLPYAWLSPLRAVLGNFIAFGAFWRAFRQYLGIQLRQRKIVWDKTDHRYPIAAALQRLPPSVTDILQHRGIITHDAAQRAMRAACETGRPLGLQILDLNIAGDGAVAEAYGEQAGLPVYSFDPFAGEPALRDLLSAEEAARFCVQPFRIGSGGVLTLVLGEPLATRERRRLERLLRRRGISGFAYAFAPLGDIAFAIRFGDGSDAAIAAARAAIARSQLPPDDQAVVWREIRSRYRRLGDAVAAAGLADHALLAAMLARAWRRGERLGAALAASGEVPLESLGRLIEMHEAWRPDIDAALAALQGPHAIAAD